MNDEGDLWWTPVHPAPPESPTSAPAPARRLGAGVAALLLLAAASGGALVAHGVWRPAAGVPAAGDGSDAAAIASHVDAGVVDVNISSGLRDLQAAGTGMVLTSDGYVLTNNHVVAGATHVSVTDVGNGRTYDATVVGYDRSHDVALLRLHAASGLSTVRTGGAVRVGEQVVAVGNAGGRGGTPSYAGGAVTAVGRSITASDPAAGSAEQLTGLVETDAGIVAGDSGGPLVDTAGRVVAMDTAASGGDGFRAGGAGPGFAVPIATALAVVSRIEGGSSSATVHVGPTAFLGVEVDGGQGAAGAAVAQVVAGGPAAAAGIVPGDTITAVAGGAVGSAQDLTQVMLALRPGSSVDVTFLDPSGRRQDVTVQLRSGPPQ